MVVKAPIKAVALGTNNTLRLLATTLDRELFNLTSVSELKEVTFSLQNDCYDIVLVDSKYKDAELACEFIYGMDCVAVGLITDENKTDWKRIQWWYFDGVITINAKKEELIARIKAICRKRSKKQYPKSLLNNRDL
jgi:hypothetical protein